MKIKEWFNKIELSSSTLKWIAIVFMLLNHICIGVAIRFHSDNYFLNQAHWYLTRFAFIIFAFQISEGMVHTHDRFKYILWLFFFALISEIPFDLALKNKVIYMNAQNVFWTLGLGALTIYAYDRLTGKRFFQILVIITAMALATLLRTDYAWQGVLFIVVFYIFRADKKKQLLFFLIVFLVSLPFVYIIEDIINGMALKDVFSYNVFIKHAKNAVIELHALAALPLIALYKGKKGKIRNKWFFYAFYPSHLLLIYSVLAIVLLCVK